MPHRGSAGSRRPSGSGESSRSVAAAEAPPAIVAFDPIGEILAGDNRAAARAALAESFAERFGVDDAGPSAATLADRFGFRYERSGADPALQTGRRTVTIDGRGAARAVAPAQRTPVARPGRTTRRATGRGLTTPAPLRVDRVALIAVGLGLLLAFLAATSAHASTLGALR